MFYFCVFVCASFSYVVTTFECMRIRVFSVLLFAVTTIVQCNYTNRKMVKGDPNNFRSVSNSSFNDSSRLALPLRLHAFFRCTNVCIQIGDKENVFELVAIHWAKCSNVSSVIHWYADVLSFVCNAFLCVCVLRQKFRFVLLRLKCERVHIHIHITRKIKKDNIFPQFPYRLPSAMIANHFDYFMHFSAAGVDGFIFSPLATRGTDEKENQIKHNEISTSITNLSYVHTHLRSHFMQKKIFMRSIKSSKKMHNFPICMYGLRPCVSIFDES